MERGFRRLNDRQQHGGTEMKVKRLREVLQTSITKPRVTKRSYLKDNVDDGGAISSGFAYISRLDQFYDNQKVVEEIARDIMCIAKWSDVAVSMIAVCED